MTKYNICKSVNQWATDCPDINFLEVTCLASEIVLHQTNDELKSLLSETWNSAFLKLKTDVFENNCIIEGSGTGVQ